MKIELWKTIIAPVIVGIILMIIAPTRDFIIFCIGKIGNFIKIVVLIIWKYLTTTHEISGFIIFVSVILWILFIFILFIIIKKSLFGKTYTSYTSYTEDMFYGMKWRWSWNDGKIRNLWCFCPRCEFELSYQNKTYYRNVFYGIEKNIPTVIFICEHCRNEYPVEGYDKDYLLNVIKREILRKIRIGEKPDKQEVSNAQT